jgi:hypothetical protein
LPSNRAGYLRNPGRSVVILRSPSSVSRRWEQSAGGLWECRARKVRTMVSRGFQRQQKPPLYEAFLSREGHSRRTRMAAAPDDSYRPYSAAPSYAQNFDSIVVCTIFPSRLSVTLQGCKGFTASSADSNILVFVMAVLLIERIMSPARIPAVLAGSLGAT